jgi:glucans biosynthesis protein
VSFLSRRRLMAAALALAASPALAEVASVAGPPLGPPAPFSFDRLKARAARSARQAYVPTAASPLADVDYDAIGQITYRPDKTLWGGRHGDAAVRFFHLQRYAKRPVKIYAVDGGQAREVLYSEALFDVRDPGLARRLAGVANGFAGFRAMQPGRESDWLAFQGASYFRSADPFDQYGLSARGLAIDTATAGPESFPDFTAFWLERDASGDLTVYATLEGEAVAGAYRIANRRGPKGLVQDIESALFFRKPVARLGIAPLTSMFWYGAGGAPGGRDWRPQIHDSDGLAIWTGAGERIWRPLVDPPRVVVNSFADHGPRGFGLLQRDRVFDHYQDDGVFYDRRPSAWVEPIGDWGPGAVELAEIPTDDETNDNIVAFWTPAAPVRAGEAMDLRYRLYWGDEEPSPPDVARVVATRIGQGGRPGQPRPPHVKKLVVDFEGETLGGLTRDSGVEPVVNVERGRIEDAAAYPIAGTSRWRLMLDVTVLNPDSADLRAYLGRNGAALSETWSYQLFSG